MRGEVPDDPVVERAVPLAIFVDRTGVGRVGALASHAPGVLLAAAIAVASSLAAGSLAGLVPVPALVIALVAGMVLNPVVFGPVTKPGTDFCVRTVLRWAVALLGIRVGLADLAALGTVTAALIVASMAATIVSGFAFARRFGLSTGFGALAGVGTAVCGASATLAASTVVPDYAGKSTDIVFVVVAVNALATVAMLLYPPICIALGFGPQATGVMLGGTIHDVAQVAGAGYAVSEAVGNTAVVVKLFRVFLLLPVVLMVGAYLARLGMAHGRARVPVPLFAIGFVLLCLVNSAVPHVPSLAGIYAPIKDAIIELSGIGLILAIAALGLATSFKAFVGLGWRHIATVVGSTLVLLATVCVGLVLLPAG
jgi:uncharacterized integral membrane protein (TIGR00698 family)